VQTAWDLRVDNTKVLEHYLQETQASMLLASLSELKREEFLALATAADELVVAVVPLVRAGVPPRLWHQMIVSGAA
jgi:hypothetical protein